MSADYRVASRACSRCGEVEPLDQDGVCYLCIAEERLEQARRELSRAKSELENIEQQTHNHKGAA